MSSSDGPTGIMERNMSDLAITASGPASEDYLTQHFDRVSSRGIGAGTKPAIATLDPYVLEVTEQKERLVFTLYRRQYEVRGSPLQETDGAAFAGGSSPSVAMMSNEWGTQAIVVYQCKEDGTIAMKLANMKPGTPTRFGQMNMILTGSREIGEEAAKAYSNEKDKEKCRKLYTPSVAASDDRCVLACRTGKNQITISRFQVSVEDGRYLLYHRGTLIAGQGQAPSVAMWADTFAMISQSENGDELWLQHFDVNNYFAPTRERLRTRIHGRLPCIGMTGAEQGIIGYTDSYDQICLRRIGFPYRSADTIVDRITLQGGSGVASSIAATGEGMWMLVQAKNKTVQRSAWPISSAESWHIRHSTWMDDMGALIGTRPLNCISMPGTHDSGMYMTQRLTWATFAGEPVVLTQSASIYEQLMLGVRFFDLRFNFVGGRYTIAHGVSSWQTGTTFQGGYGPDLDTVLADIIRFMKDRREVLILRFTHLLREDTVGFSKFSDEETNTLAKYVVWKLGPLVFINQTKTSLAATQLNTFTANGTRGCVLPVFQYASPDTVVVGGAHRYSTFRMKGWYSDKDDLKELWKDQSKNLNDAENHGPNTIFLLWWTLTLGKFDTANPWSGESIIELARKANERFAAFVKDAANPTLQKPRRDNMANVVMVDDFPSAVTEYCIEMNSTPGF